MHFPPSPSLLEEKNCSELHWCYLQRCQRQLKGWSMGSAKQVVIDYGCCSKLCITATNQLWALAPARSLQPTARLPSDAKLSSRVNPIIKTSLWYTSLEPKKKSVFKLDKNMHLHVMFILHEYGGEEDSFE